MAKKIAKLATPGDVEIFGMKLNVHIQYNMLRIIWLAPVA